MNIKTYRDERGHVELFIENHDALTDGLVYMGRMILPYQEQLPGPCPPNVRLSDLGIARLQSAVVLLARALEAVPVNSPLQREISAWLREEA